MAKTYSIFGAGAAGLYTAWRLMGGGDAEGQEDNPKALRSGDTLELYDWGKYAFNAAHPGTRAAGARVCTWHHEDDPTASFVEVGGIRYSEWDGSPGGAGHRLVTTVIKKLGLDEDSTAFDESTNPLYYLRARNVYLNELPPRTGWAVIRDLALGPEGARMTRKDWCRFYKQGIIQADLGDFSTYKKGDLLRDIGLWNLMFDRLGSEGYQSLVDGRTFNWNAADAIRSIHGLATGIKYKTLKTGYSSMFTGLFDAIVRLSSKKGIAFDYHPDTRLHSILGVVGAVQYWTATRELPDKATAQRTTDAAWLAMPRYALELVSQATRYRSQEGVAQEGMAQEGMACAGLDVLNHPSVRLYLESVIMQPSCKVGMFFDQEWWVKGAGAGPVYPAPITSYEITKAVLASLKMRGFPGEYIDEIRNSGALIADRPFTSEQEFFKAIEHCVGASLTLAQGELLLKLAQHNTTGPSITDTPIRQVIYFGNNATTEKEKPMYGLVASYDHEQFTTCWQEPEHGSNLARRVAASENYQPLAGPRKVPESVVKMLRSQLAALHFGHGASHAVVPEPLDARYMDWSLPPFHAGHHTWSAHYDIGDVQRKIRKPSQLIEGADSNIFIVGEAYSNDQAWVEGAYCTAESVLTEFFGSMPIISQKDYPFICEG